VVVIGVSVVGVAVIAVELEQLDVIGELEDTCAGGFHLLDDADHPLLEPGTVHDQQVGVLHRLGLSS
jgi:hypothetical protein